MIFSCGLGTGKSFVINSWRDFLKSGCSVSAYTGRAAHNVVGQTLHSLLQIPCRTTFSELKGPQLSKLQNQFRDAKMLVIDEYSMVGCEMLGYIDSRLRQARPTHSHQPFGGISIVLVGDMLQLPPVADRPLYKDNLHNCKDSFVAGILAFKLFKKVVLLTEQMRTNPEEILLQKLIDNVRNSTATIDDWNVAKTRMIGNLSENDKKRCEEAVYIMYNNKNVDEHNDMKLAKVKDQRTCRINSMHNGENASKATSTSIGLPAYLRLCRGARVMITMNLWKNKGIVNGTLGYVRYLIFRHNEGPPSLPVAVIVELDQPYNGPHLIGKPRHVPICPVTMNGVGSRGPIERTQLPIRLAWAITTFKVQGMTLPAIHVNLGDREPAYGGTNVAISRVRSLKNIFFDPFDLSRITSKLIKPPELTAFMDKSLKLINDTKTQFES